MKGKERERQMRGTVYEGKGTLDYRVRKERLGEKLIVDRSLGEGCER